MRQYISGVVGARECIPCITGYIHSIMLKSALKSTIADVSDYQFCFVVLFDLGSKADSSCE